MCLLQFLKFLLDLVFFENYTSVVSGEFFLQKRRGEEDNEAELVCIRLYIFCPIYFLLKI